MKVLNVIVVMFIALLLFSCKKTDEFAKPSLQQGAGSLSQQDAKLLLQKDPKLPKSDKPFFNEKNATQIKWADMSKELREAIPIESLKDPTETPKKDKKYPGTNIISYYYSVGPYGGTGGDYFSIYPYPAYDSYIYAIAINSGIYVDHITIWYKLYDGSIVVGGDRGGSGGYYSLLYFAPDEYIYYVAGRSGSYLDRFTFYTNYKWCSFGGWGGYPFYYDVPNDYQVLGFFGRSGSLIDQLGFYIYSRY